MAEEIAKAGPPAPQSPFAKPINPTGDITNSIMSTPGAAPTWDLSGATNATTFTEIGTSGLRAFAGWVKEEFLPELQGRQGAQKYREMGDNSPTVGAVIHAIKSTMRKVEWRVIPPNDSGPAKELADFIDSCRDDMSHTWEDLVDENLSALQYGYAPHEIVYKRRLGKKPPKGADGTDDPPKSEYDDGKIGWRRIPIRGQDTIIQWFFDSYGAIKGVRQLPWTGIMRDIPIEKMLLFRVGIRKNNPEGRALDPDTPIPTPDGWRKLDDLAVGDKVFDERGFIRYVVARADWENRPTYRVSFNDGTEIVADENHLWETTTLSERSRGLPGKERTTRELFSSLKTGTGSSNHAICWAEPLDYPEQMLPLAPYFVGQWLGDGTSLSAHISCHAQDLDETVQLINACGYDAHQVVENGRTGGNGRLIKVFSTDGRWDSQGPQALLRALGLRGNKHIPQSYLRGSIEQRRALLAGLMDSDGTVDSYGRCEFNNCNLNLIYGVAELVRSLGCSAYVSLKGHAGTGNRKQDSWSVKFRPEWTPFRLSRKAARIRGHRARDLHYVVSVEPAPNGRTVCIEVDSPSHLFLAGEGMIPTHNSVLRSSYVPYYFIKRLQEQEAIMGERMGGVPVVKVPMAMIEAANAGDAKAQASMNSFKNLAVNLRIDEQMGVVMPSDVWQGANGPSAAPMFVLELITPSGGARTAMNFEAAITRYNISIMTSVLADFLTLGHEARGTQSLAVTKVDLFFQAIEGYLNSFAAIYNRYAIPRLWELNGFNPDLMPQLEPDLAQRVDLDVLSNYVLRMSQAGMPMFPNEELQTFLLDAAGMPDVSDPRALQAAGLMDDQLDREDDKDDAVLDNMQKPPQPAAKPNGQTSNLDKMILASLAKRIIRMQGPRFGITTTKRRKNNGATHHA